MTRYEPLDVVSFGEALIRTGDLDPVYEALRGAVALVGDAEVLDRWLLAYWLFYDAGLASNFAEAEDEDFWDVVASFAGAPASKRGRERRHFRGPRAVAAIAALRAKFERPQFAVETLRILSHMDADGPVRASVIRAEVERWPMFGPWISFKAADMLERVAGCPVLFSVDDALYEEPAKGAKLVDPIAPPAKTLARLVLLFRERPLRVWGGGAWRPVGPAEVETILCKFKGHAAGRYPVGLDSEELARSLEATTAYPIARDLLAHVPVVRP